MTEPGLQAHSQPFCFFNRSTAPRLLVPIFLGCSRSCYQCFKHHEMFDNALISRYDCQRTKNDSRVSEASVKMTKLTTDKSRTSVTCGTCGTRFNLDETNSPPFCSQRCKLVDLKRWIDEEISLPHEGGSDDGDVDES